MTEQPNGKLNREQMQRDCWDGALHTYGTSFIFSKRAALLKRKLQVLTYTGIALPLIIGATTMSFGLDFPLLKVLIAFVAVLLIFQLAVSLWSVVAGWVDAHAYSVDSMTANEVLNQRYERLAKAPPSGSNFKIQYDLVHVDDLNRRQLDLRQQPTEKERRQGMRATLRQYRRSCATCGEVPTSLTPTTCDTCGNF